MLTPEVKRSGTNIGAASESSFQSPKSKCHVTSTSGIKFPFQLYTVAEVESTDGDFAAVLWMPESSMVSHAFSASQAVAVLVCGSSLFEYPEASHVENLEERCGRELGFASSDCLIGDAGSYCVISTIWPCRKLKDGVRLSKQLAYALGCPQPGTHIFVAAITCSMLEQDRKLKPNKATAIYVNIHDCQELVLRWCAVNMKDKPFQNSSSAKETPEQQRTVSKSYKKTSLLKDDELECEEMTPEQQRSAPKGNKKTSSLKASKHEAQNQTLLQKKHGDGGESKLSSKAEITVNMWQKNDEAALSELLADANSRATKLVQRFAGRLLHERYLMKGNIVGILICGRYCLFKVVDAKVLSRSRDNVYDKAEQKFGLPWTEVPNLLHVGNYTRIAFATSSIQADIPVRLDGNEGPMNGGIQSSQDLMVPLKQVDFSQLGGLSDQISTLKEIIKFSLLQPERLISLGLQPPHGVLLHGPPGTGKTSLALAAAKEAGVKFFPINGPEIITEYYGESEAALQSVFAEAQAAAPSVVFIDELDAIAPQRSDESEGLGRRLVATLLTVMDGSKKYLHRVLVVAATNRPEAIDSALRRPGRFDREIEIGVPTPSGRLEILTSLLSRMKHSLTNADIEILASATHGFVGADLSSLCNEAALAALRRNVQRGTRSETNFQKLVGDCINQGSSIEVSDVALDLSNLNISTDLEWSNDSLRITVVDFEEAKTKVRPSGMREVMIEVPKVYWSDIGGQEEAKQQLREAVEWPQKHNDAFSRIGAQPPRGILLYGPPGCSKTLMARAVATEAGLNFIAVKGPELFSKWVGESEKAVHLLFRRAQVSSPSVVFFDELDGLAVSRDSGHGGASIGDRVMSQLLVELDGLSLRNGVTVIAATNRPDKIDTALLRPGRFDRLVYVGPPDEAARLQIFNIHTRNMPCALDVNIRDLSIRTKGYTGADIAGICREAAMAALEEDLNTEKVSMRHFDSALKIVPCSVSEVSESMYQQFSRSSI